MSGSIISNVLTAGTMTIPVMKKSGFRASYAGAIEACASTGAVLAPPVMGATAFVIAQFLNVSYAEVAVAAIIPAVLYYVGLFMQVDSYAARHGLKGIPRAELPQRDGYDQGRLVLHLRHRAAGRDAALLQAREPRAVLRHRAAAGAEPAVLQGHALDACDHQQVPGGQRPHLRRTGRHSRRLRPPDRRVLDDRRGLEPRQRPARASPATTPSCCSRCAPSPA